MYSYMSSHTTTFPCGSIHLYIIFRINTCMGKCTFPVNIATTVAILPIVLTMITRTMTKQPLVFEDTKHCNTNEASCYNLECDISQQR